MAEERPRFSQDSISALLGEIARAPEVRPAPKKLAGGSRFTIRRRIGEGGFGVVYEAWDGVLGSVVALKTLRTGEPERIYRLKREFRALRVVHPNLVRLHQLFAEGESCLFSMEYVDGKGFLEWLGPKGGSEGGRLRAALRQLVAGLSALHRAGVLHRDVKPSNILVDGSGRVVLLDFGLATDCDWAADSRSFDQNALAGTPSYLSPEQVRGDAATAASDWYAVGVTLFQALTGRLPVEGTRAEILDSKRHGFEPSLAGADAPVELRELCAALLRSRPEDRPGEQEILQRLAAVPEPPAPAPVPRQRSGIFVGRGDQLRALGDALELTRSGAPVTVHLQGRSGMGKTALVQRFVEESRAQGAVVLAGRCYERESVPYKALDELIDRLGAHLKRLSRPEAERLLPRDVASLARLFPSLGRVPAIADAPRRPAEAPDPQEARRRAFAALKELFGRMSERAPLVLVIDDLQWSDADSGAILAELLGPQDPPALLLVAAYRSEEARSNPCIRSLREAHGVAVREVTVDPLSAPEARDLALALLERDDPPARDRAVRLALDSEGSPFFVGELVRSGLDEGGPHALADLLRNRVAARDEESRRLLEVVAVAGSPIEQDVAQRAAGIAGNPASLVALVASRLVRTTGSSDGDRVEVFHDRVREAVIESLAPERLAAHHSALAASLEEKGDADPERLFAHLEGAGQGERAAVYARIAADRAAEALAFDRAAWLYGRAMKLRAGAPRRTLEALRADALANAGRGAEAAEAYLAAAQGAPAARAFDLKRRAAEEFLRAGYLDRGLVVAREVLRDAGLPLSTTPRRALAALLVRRARNKLRLTLHRDRERGRVSSGKLLRLDTCWGITAGLSLQDHIRGAELQARHLAMALKAGEPVRLVRALTTEAAFAAQQGGSRGGRKAGQLLDLARKVAARAEHPENEARLTQMEGGIHFFLGRWRKAAELSDRSEAICREKCRAMFWEQSVSQQVSHMSLILLGEFEELGRRIPAQLRDAQRRGDLFALTGIRVHAVGSELAADRPEEAERLLREASIGLSTGAYCYQHLQVLSVRLYCHFYRGEAAAALALLTDQWPAISRSLLLTVQVTRILMDHRRGFAAVTAAGVSAVPGKCLSIARRSAERIEGEGTAWGMPLARTLRAGVAAFEGDRPRAAQLFGIAATELDAADMPAFAASARRRKGELVGGPDGAALVSAADAWMRAHGIRNPERLADLMAPPVRGS